jgi:DinB superfamily
MPEVWLRGEAVDGVPPLLQPVAHSLRQCREEVEAVLSGLTGGQIWQSANGAASIGFHVLHGIGSLDRLLTYARGAMLSEVQLLVLQQEAEADPDLTSDDLAAAFDAAVARAIDQLRETDERRLTDERHVGRARLRSTVAGLLFHAAEHTQRHVGQAVTTRRLLWP